MNTAAANGRRLDVSIEHGDQCIGGTWHPTAVEAHAAWELVVELTTRVPVIPLRDDEGLLEEALASLAAVFTASRAILRSHGPGVAAHREGELSLGVLVGVMLNQVVRPVTAYWHPALSGHVEQRPAGTSRLQSELAFPQRADLVRTLQHLGATLTEFAKCFAAASGTEEFLRTQLEREQVLYAPQQRRAAQGRQ